MWVIWKVIAGVSTSFAEATLGKSVDGMGID
jgi:hypothetical protein